MNQEESNFNEDMEEDVRLEKRMTVMQHLEELRWVILKCGSVFIAGCVVIGFFFPYFAKVLMYPLNQAVGEGTSLLQGLVTTSPMGIFSVLIQICLLGGLAISMPFMLYFIASYVRPGLSFKEKTLIFPCSMTVLGLFLLGASFSYFYVIPASLSVAISLNELIGFQLIWSASRYYGLVVWMTLGIGVCFEFPLVILLLVYLGIISTEKLKQLRRHMVVAVLVAAALITPSGDPFSLAILAVPLYILYEASIIVGRRIEKKRLESES